MLDQNPGALLRKFTQEDLLASGVRVALGIAGPVGTIVGEFLTQFVPAQRVDRLVDFVERLHERLGGLEEDFKARLASTPGFAALAEDTAVAAVRTASAEHRRDLAALLVHGLSRADAEMIEEHALLELRNRLNDVQVILLMSYGNFRRMMTDPELEQFWGAHPGIFAVMPPTMTSSADERRQFTMKEHYEAGLESVGLLRDTEGVAKSTGQRRYEITPLGRLLLEAIGRYRDPRHST